MGKLPRICLVVNKSRGHLGPSETFIQAHIDGLAGTVLPLIGNPLKRKCRNAEWRYLLPQDILSRSLRYSVRTFRLSSVEEQDARSLERYFSAERVDVVLAEYGPTAVSVMAACQRTDIPLVSHFHGWDVYVLSRHPDVVARYEQLFRRSAAIVAVSTHMLEKLVELGAPRSKVHYNPCGAAMQGTSASPATAAIRFVAVGRLTPKKAPHITLRSFARLVATFPGARLDLVGDGPLLSACKSLVSELGIDANATLHGSVPHHIVFDLLQHARCFVQHSVIAPDGDSEGTPVSVLEAMAAGLPVVATRHGGIRDVVEDGVTGYLVDEHDEVGMAEAMARLASSPALAGRMGAQGARAVADRWSMDHSLARLSTIIGEACESRPQRESPSA